MDFFAQQEAARRKSAWLTLLAVLFLLPILAVTGLIFRQVIVWFLYALELRQFDELSVDLVAMLLSCAVVLVSGLVAYLRISSGEALMRRLRARRANRGADQTLVNVTEEMALASGADMPSVWVLDDDRGVNAFAAGFGDGDSALCVTAGALRHLRRDELQGVVAHEFGHILNGDMRLNSRLVALVEGLSGIATLGKTMLHPLTGLFRTDDDDDRWGHNWGGWRGGSGKGGGSLGLIILIYLFAGVSLWLVGLVGVFFARILQGAVSREREYLADAAAVQFTRNPEGLANALRFANALAGLFWTNRSESAANVCHMFFIGESWSRDSAHPPVAERVARLSPGGLRLRDGEFRERMAAFRREREETIQRNHERYCGAQSVQAQFGGEEIRIPADVMARLRTPSGAGETLCMLLRGQDLLEWPGPMSAAAKRAVVGKAVMALQREGTPAAVAAWADSIENLAKEHGEVGSFEFLVLCAVRRRLRASEPPPQRPSAALSGDAAAVVSLVARFGANGDAAYEIARQRLAPFFPAWPERPEQLDSVRRIFGHLDALRALTPIVKRELLMTLKVVVSEDGVVTDDEANYVAAVADAIGAYGWC